MLALRAKPDGGRQAPTHGPISQKFCFSNALKQASFPKMSGEHTSERFAPSSKRGVPCAGAGFFRIFVFSET